MKLNLYTAPSCELCEVAMDLIYLTLPSGSYDLCKVDVTANIQLKKQYGLRIPVLGQAMPVLEQLEANKELSWPFDASQLLKFIDQLERD